MAVRPTAFPFGLTRPWTVYVMPTSHIDLYSTGLADETPEEHARVLDAAVALADEFTEYRYQIENMLPIFEYRQLRPAAAMERLAELIRGGRFAFGAQYTGLHQEEASAEELVQGQLLEMRELEEAYGIRPSCGYTVDVPDTTLQYPQLLVRCGIRYWIFSPNRFPPPDGWYGLGPAIRRLPRLFRSRALDGSAVWTWLPHEHYGEDQKRMGLENSDIEATAATLPRCLRRLEDEGYPADAYLLEHSYGDNLPPTRQLPEMVRAWNERHDTPRLVMATAEQFFRHIEATRPEVPEMRFQVLDVWAWIVANQGVLNPMARRAVHDLICAEALWSGCAPSEYPEEELRRAFSELAKVEGHDWFYGGGQVAGIPDLAKAAWARTARQIAARQLGRAFGGEHRHRAGDTRVLNPCAWARRDVVVAPRRALVNGTGSPCQLVDGETVATHFSPQPHSVAHPPPQSEVEETVAFTCELTALGTTGAVGPAVASSRHRGDVLENRHYRIRFDPVRGAIGSITDKESGRELIDSEVFGFGQLALGSPSLEGLGIGFGGTVEQATADMRQSLRSWAACRLELARGLRGPVFSSLLLRGEVGGSPATQAIVLYEDLRRIDIVISIEWSSEPIASRLIAAFPFALHPFTCRYEIPFGALEVGRDETPTMPRHLRQLQTWIQFQNGADSVILASPDVGVFSLGRYDLNPIDDGAYTIPERSAAYMILADNGAPSPLVQPGRLTARFSVTTGRNLRPSDCARFAWAFARPPLVGAGCDLQPLGVEPDALLVSVIKRAWKGDAIVVRVVEYDGRAADAALHLPFAPRAAWLADPVEHPIAPALVDGHRVRFAIRAHEVLTFLIERPAVETSSF